jgi:aminoglycoside 6'-N-acetyltransferase I
MHITIDRTDSILVDELARLTYKAFKTHAPDWLPTTADARRRVLQAAAPDRINRVLLNPHAKPLGWIGVTPINHGRIWEIHPLAIAPAEQGKGYGSMLVNEIEWLAQLHGVLGLLVGTSDETGATPLYGVDLYQNPCELLNRLTCAEQHAVTFWRKVGFTVVGVLPDAEGRGRPGITLAKRVA